ncbi:DAK2 domain-containing protein, partial [Kineococcus glutinatus]|uniref:DAK2 domain-containing protein n=1 Tax=Kineococcus glutinatus TaxID=1070872 RepID=UPI0031E8B4F4
AAVARAAQAALDGVTRLGGAKPGDKTLVDALVPFARVIVERVVAAADVRTAWRAAAEASTTAAEATRDLRPQLRRARPQAERSSAHPDAGAASLALVTRTALAALDA